MKVVFYFIERFKGMLTIALVLVSLTSHSRSPGIENGALIIAPENDFQHAPLSVSQKRLSLGTKEYIGQIKQPTLVVLISFNNIEISTSSTEWADRIFNNEYSVKSFFQTNSNEGFIVTPATQSGVINVSVDIDHPDFGSDYSFSSKLANKALEQVGKQIDLSQFDTNLNQQIEVRELAFVLVAAGYEKSFGGDNASHPNVWGHQSSSYLFSGKYRAAGYVLFGEKHGSKQASIGIICHELGHLYFNLPDLYDRDGSSAGAGNWGVMSYGTWGSSGNQLGDRPVNMLAWSRNQIGFVELSEPKEGVEITHDRPVKVTTENEDEYFIVEYREQSGFDQSLSGSGILITHIDERVSSINDNEHHKLLDIEEADGDQGLDLFRNYGSASDLFATNHSQWSFTEDTTPNSDSYSKGPSSVSIMFSTIDESTNSVGITFFEDAPVAQSPLHVGDMNMIWLSALVLMMFYGLVFKKIRKRFAVQNLSKGCRSLTNRNKQ
ncbi:M6 family metalloprotease domain-containing protein [Marinicellulosiphila megalodicopiae]|uniref:M6 family metalloprotease domain-containing protein n=1 Tax=Marinicellulosiphila megalodicopiae TaxID=2724896 RepID=UPI003BAEE338